MEVETSHIEGTRLREAPLARLSLPYFGQARLPMDLQGTPDPGGYLYARASTNHTPFIR